MRQTGFMECVRNPHFRALCVPIRAGYSWKWRHEHATVPFWTLLRQLSSATRNYDLAPLAYPSALQELLSAIGRASPQLRYRTEDLSGYLQLLEQEGAWLAAVFLGYASAKSLVVTPAEVAAATGTAESTWRNKAAAGNIPAAIKSGKQWLLPRDVMEIVFGLNLPESLGQRDPDDVAGEDAEAREQPMTEEEYREVKRELNQNR